MNIKPTIALLAVAGALAGCGGGGSAATPEPPKLSDAQGFWSGPLTGATTLNATSTQAVVLPDGTAWMLLLPASGAPTGMVKARLALATPGTGSSATTTTAGYTGSGTVYTLATGGASAVTMTGTSRPDGRLDATLTSSGATTATQAALSFSSAYGTAATVADVAGNWTVSASSGALRVNWAVAPGGSLTGTSTTGCTWTGGFATRPGGTAVLDFNATETCNGVATVFSGIAVPNGAKTAVTAFVTTGGDANGMVLTLARPAT